MRSGKSTELLVSCTSGPFVPAWRDFEITAFGKTGKIMYNKSRYDKMRANPAFQRECGLRFGGKNRNDIK
jgi:hypothetical protein